MMRVLAVILLGLMLAPASDAGWFHRKPKQQKPKGARYGLSKREQAKDAAKARQSRAKTYRWKHRR